MTKDFFISYNSADRAWAEWIAWVLEEKGYNVIIQAWDFRPGGNFVLDMQRAAEDSERTIMVLSEDYLKAKYTQPEWAAAFRNDPESRDRKLIPIRVAECKPSGILGPLVYVDLVGRSETEAEQLVLRLLAERVKPATRPLFPGKALTDRRVVPNRVSFPGNTDSQAAGRFSEKQINSLDADVKQVSPIPKQQSNAKMFRSSLLASLGVLTLLITARFFGVLQSLELGIYDFFMRLPPYEQIDNRIAIVGVQRSELAELYAENPPTEISDLKVKEIIEFLLTLNKPEDEPRIIGLDIFRDEPQLEPENSGSQRRDYYVELKNLVNIEENSVVLTCRRDIKDDPSGFKPISKEASFGFNDLVVDPRKGNLAVVRRHFLTNDSFKENKDCRVEESFGYKIALRFLSINGILTEVQEKNWKDELIDKYGRIKVEDTTFEPVWPRTGGFQGILAAPYQILLNYRNTGLGHEHTFKIVNAIDILKCPVENLGCNLDNQDRKILEDASVVLIGYVGERSKDEHLTPLGRLHGVEIHAHAISYILSTVIADEYAIPRLRVLPVLMEVVCIILVGLSGFGAARVAYDSSRLSLLTPKIAIAVIIPGAVMLLFVGSWTAFSLGLWLPFLPLSLGFVSSALGVYLVETIQLKKTNG